MLGFYLARPGCPDVLVDWLVGVAGGGCCAGGLGFQVCTFRFKSSPYGQGVEPVAGNKIVVLFVLGGGVCENAEKEGAVKAVLL